MTSYPIGLLLEAVVAVLLMVTVGYCFVLNRKLTRLRSHHSELRDVVVHLNSATDTAEAAISGLRQTMLDADQKLSGSLISAARLRDELGALTDGEHRWGGEILERPVVKPPAPSAPPAPAAAPPVQSAPVVAVRPVIPAARDVRHADVIAAKTADPAVSSLEQFRATTDWREIERRLDNLKRAS